MNKPIEIVVYGKWDDCMKVVRKAKTHLKTPSKRLYNRWDIEEILDYQFKQFICSQDSNKKKTMRWPTRGDVEAIRFITNTLGAKQLIEDDEIFKLTLYKD
jgi:hypothetical protein